MRKLLRHGQGQTCRCHRKVSKKEGTNYNMSLLKFLAGVLVGLIACGILLFLISVRSPVSPDPRIAVVPEPVVVEPIEAETIEVEPVDDAQQVDTADEAPAAEPEEPVATPEPTPAVTPAPADPADTETPTLTDTPTEETQTGVNETPETLVPNPETVEPEVMEPDDTPNKIARLPTIGSNGGSRIKLSGDEPEIGSVESFGAFELNAENYVGKDLPFLSIVLVDLGIEGANRSELLSLAVPVTFAIPAAREGAARASADYRDAGQEVLIIPPLDGNFDGGDVAQYAGLLPDALGLVDAPTAGLQRDRAALKTVLEGFKTTGHALLTYDIGLNSTGREAAKFGIKSAKVFRILDGKGENTAAILRQLDRAVLEANQEGGAIVLGHSHPDTIEAIRAWSQGSSASGVDVAPVSAAIRALSQ